MFSALGFYFTTRAKTYDSFIYAISGFIVPMSLFCGTYFPMSRLPVPAQYVVYALPLTHAVVPVRNLASGIFAPKDIISVVIVLILSIVFTNIAAKNFERKIII